MAILKSERGHIMRCLSIANEAKEMGETSLFLLSSNDFILLELSFFFDWLLKLSSGVILYYYDLIGLT